MVRYDAVRPAGRRPPGAGLGRARSPHVAVEKSHLLAGVAEVLAELKRRDEIDSTRAVSPLRPAPDAVILVTDGNRFEQTVATVVATIREAEHKAERAAAGKQAVAHNEPIDGRPEIVVPVFMNVCAGS